MKQWPQPKAATETCWCRQWHHNFQKEVMFVKCHIWGVICL